MVSLYLQRNGLALVAILNGNKKPPLLHGGWWWLEIFFFLMINNGGFRDYNDCISSALFLFPADVAFPANGSALLLLYAL